MNYCLITPTAEPSTGVRWLVIHLDDGFVASAQDRHDAETIAATYVPRAAHTN